MDPDPSQSRQNDADATLRKAYALMGGKSAFNELKAYVESAIELPHIDCSSADCSNILFITEELLEQAQTEHRLPVDLSHLRPADMLTLSMAVLESGE